MGEYSREIAKAGLEIKAIKLRPEDPFQWASGFMMPIYNDNRMFLFHPHHRDMVVDALCEYHDQLDQDIDVIAGTSTAGIAPGALLADRLKKPFIYIRDKPKAHGLKNQIEGIDADSDLEGRSVLLIEDLISTGGSSARAVQAIRDANGEIDYCFSIFNYGLEKAMNAFDSLDQPCVTASVLTYDVLLDVAKNTGYISKEHLEMLKEWREDPFGWGKKHGFPKVEK